MSKSTLNERREGRRSMLVVGDVMLDRYWFGEVNRISPEAPVPIVRIDRREERLGGAANVARNSVALGVNTSLLGVVGQDEAGDIVEKLLQDSHIASYLNRDKQISTIIKLRVIGRQQQLLRVDFEEAPSEGVLRDKLSQFHTLLPDHDVIILSDYAKGSLVNVTDMIASGIALNKMILVDPKGSDFTRYTGATILTPNRSELRQVIGDWKSEAELTVKAQNLRMQLRLQALLVTRSEEGMSLYTDDLTHHVPTMAREVFDVSGAGDTVIATLGAMLASGKPLVESVEIANRAAGIVVGKLGTATVTHEELFLK
ncbi:rfaE bifunctional protein kinase chain/domain [Oxalobacteraceae bacterium GrIS 2.11]